MPAGKRLIRRRRRRRRRRAVANPSLYQTPRYRRWRARVFARDRHTCRLCGATKVYLEAHHILRKADFPHLTYRVSNGITLCKACHEKVTGQEHRYASLFLAVLKGRPAAEG